MRGMHKRAWASAVAAVCMVYVLMPAKAQAAPGEWTWMSGANIIDQIGVYGTKGIPAASNVPGARDDSISWTDNSGNLWLFGGFGKDSIDRYGNQSLNDLWRYDTNGQWAWISGSKTFNQYGTYGTKGTPSAANVPGAHLRSTSWTDNSGNLWLFGGHGYATPASGGNKCLNDLWRYEPATNQWTWMSGSDMALQAGVYGEKGIPAAANVPGARSDSISWTDNSGNLWLFGGETTIAFSTVYLNDLWRYEPAANQWTWMSGAATTNQTSVYGTQGVPDAANVPGARTDSISWTDNSGNLWLFGGVGYASARLGALNDLWRYNPGTNIWTWMSGSDMRWQTGVYGTQGVPDAANVPGARRDSISWTDSSGILWLFGGWGYDSTGYLEKLNDLWRYNPGTNMWTWVSGASTIDQLGVYGTKGIPAASNVPGARQDSIPWTDNSGNLWLFGGWGNASTTPSGDLNDLWRYEVPPECETDADCGAGAVCEQGICDLPFECMGNADCDDALFCNGEETCSNNVCVVGSSPCSGEQRCDETGDACVDIECFVEADCPEGEVCNVATGLCVECVTAADCEDAHACVTGVCEPIPPPSPWSFEQIDPQCDINRIFTLSETEIYAGGAHGVTFGGCLYHYDGTDWEPVDSPDPGMVFALWANAADDVYVAGWDGKIHYDGTQWTTINTSTGKSIWSFSQNDVFIGEINNILRLQGGNWVTMLLPPGLAGLCVEDLWGTSTTDMYAVVGAGSIILHYDGNQEGRWDYFNNEGLEGTSYLLYRIWGTSAQGMFVLGKGVVPGMEGSNNLILHYDGSVWTTSIAPVPSTDWLKAIWGSGPDDVYITTEKGYILHYDGISWSIINSQVNPASQPVVSENNQLSETADLPDLLSLNSVCGLSAESIYFAGNDGIVIHYTPDEAGCEDDGDCDDGVFCNGPETCVNSACAAGSSPCSEAQICDEDNDQCVEVDAPPALGDGPFLTDMWRVLPTSAESAPLVDANYSVLWKFSDDFASCEGDCTHTAEYQVLGGSEWSALEVTPNAAKGTVWATLPVESLPNATTYALHYSVTDCAGQTTQSATYYFRVATSDAPPAITSALWLTDTWQVLAKYPAIATLLDENVSVLWTFSDDYGFCSGLCTHRALYRKFGDTKWLAVPASADPTGMKYAYSELPVTGLAAGTYQIRVDVRDCNAQRTYSPYYYFKVE